MSAQDETSKPRKRLVSVLGDIWAEFVGLLAVASVCVAGLTVLAAWFPVVDAINQIAPFLLLATLLVALISLTVLKTAPVVAGLAVVAAGATALRVAPDYGRAMVQSLPVSAVIAARPTVKLVTFNIHGWVMRDPGPMVAWLHATDPDYILLQEATGVSGEQVLTRLASQWPHRVDCGLPACLSVILSKQAPESTVKAASPWASAVFSAPGGTGSLALMAAHTAWPIDRPLNLLAPTATAQADQYRRIAAQVATLGPDRTILSGDFNSSGWSHGLNRLVREASLRRHSQALYSWPASPLLGGLPTGPVLAIDHVMSGRDWTLKSIMRGPALGSDHFPLVAEMAWNGSATPGRSGVVEPDIEAGR
jgi:endonuclease/exonuclease/phosphatase (EEP) superfamily protein YafD